jgi:hypothetical protein
MISLKDWNSYLKSIYEFPNSMDTIRKFPKEDEFLWNMWSSWLSGSQMGKLRTLKDTKLKKFKIGGPILIPHIHKIFNLVVKQGFPKPWTQSLIVPIFKIGDKNIPSNYGTIIISPILANLFGIILEKKISLWVEIHGKRDKFPIGLGDIIQLWTTLLHLGSLLRSAAIIKPISHVVSLTLEVDFELRAATIRLYENLLPSLQTLRDSHKKLITILESRKVVHCPLPHCFWLIY